MGVEGFFRIVWRDFLGGKDPRGLTSSRATKLQIFAKRGCRILVDASLCLGVEPSFRASTLSRRCLG